MISPSLFADQSPFAEKLAEDAQSLIADLAPASSQPKSADTYQREVLLALLDSDAERGAAIVQEALEAGYGPDEIRRSVMAPALGEIMEGINFPHSHAN